MPSGLSMDRSTWRKLREARGVMRYHAVVSKGSGTWLSCFERGSTFHIYCLWVAQATLDTATAAGVLDPSDGITVSKVSPAHGSMNMAAHTGVPLTRVFMDPHTRLTEATLA